MSDVDLIRESNKRPGIVDTSQEVYYLLLCDADLGSQDLSKLSQLNISHIHNDQELFSFLREEYEQRKGWRSWISLRTIRGIRIVKFILFEDNFVDVRELNEVPRSTEDNKYRYGSPDPPELGSNLLMLFFKHPELVNAGRHILNKIPRRCGNKLTLDDECIGYGLQYTYGWSGKRLIFMASFALVLSYVLAWMLGYFLL